MQFDFITKEDFDQFKEEMLQEMRTIFSSSASQKKWLRSSEVREMLSISPGTLQTLRTNGTLPYTKIGGTMYYDINEVEKVLRSNFVNN